MIDRYREKYANFNAGLMQEFYLYHSGKKHEFNLLSIYEQYDELFASDSIDKLTCELDQIDPYFETNRRAVSHLLCFAINSRLDAAVRGLTEAITQHESSVRLRRENKDLTFQDSTVAIGTEPDRTRRRELYDWRASIISSSNHLRAERVAKLQEAARKIKFIGGEVAVNGNDYGTSNRRPFEGLSAQAVVMDRPRYPSYSCLYQDLYQVDYKALAGKAETLLSRTEAVFETRLREAVLRDLGMTIEEASRADAIYFSHLARNDEMFGASDIMRVYSTSMAALGIETSLQKNIEIDSENRPRKSARAFCAPVRIPEEIHLVYRPYGGQSDYNALLHEAGHAQHYAWTSVSLQPEFKYTGDPALTETYAFLFNNLSADEVWLGEVLGFAESRDFVRTTILTRLMTVRRYAAKFLYELQLHSQEGISGAPRIYSDLQTRGTGFATGEEEYLFDVDDSFYSASYLRAWAFEVTLREYLKERFGRKWWASRRTGNFLKEIWATGERYSADEIAAQIGIGPITFDLLIEEFQSALR